MQPWLVDTDLRNRPALPSNTDDLVVGGARDLAVDTIDLNRHRSAIETVARDFDLLSTTRIALRGTDLADHRVGACMPALLAVEGAMLRGVAQVGISDSEPRPH